MNGAVSRARLGINCWLVLTPFLDTISPLFGYYFAPVWGTIALMARPGEPQFSSGLIFTESSNPSPSRLQERVHCELDHDVELAVDVEIARHGGTELA
jgi:hypothetical protein